MNKNTIDSFRTWLVRDNGYSTYTVKIYLKEANAFADFLKGRQISDDTIKEYRELIASNPNTSHKTKNLHISALRALLTFMELPFHHLLKSFRNRNGYRVLVLPSNDDLINFITPQNTTEPSRIDVLIRLLYVSGLRIAEALALSQPLTERITVSGKGAKPRLVFVDHTTIEMANALPATSTTTSKLFPFTSRHAQRELAKRCEDRNITTPITPHTLRHLFATTMLAKGTDIRVVQRLLGHASIATTQIYAQVSDTLLEQAHAKHPFNTTP